MTKEGVRDAQTKPPYPEAFKQPIAELAMVGRSPAELSREFSVSAQNITAWVARAAADAGKPARGKDVLSSAEREELARLRRRANSSRSETSWGAFGSHKSTRRSARLAAAEGCRPPTGAISLSLAPENAKRAAPRAFHSRSRPRSSLRAGVSCLESDNDE